MLMMPNAQYIHQHSTHENVAQVREISLNRRIANHEVAYMFRISFTSAQSILKDILNMCHFAIKFMPHLLNEKQKEIHGDTWQGVPHPPSRDTSFISQY
jgi:hypothetical protein